MKFELKAALVAMGYRRMNDEPEIWGKPVGYSLVSVKDCDEVPTIFCHFKDCQGGISCWNAEEIEPCDTAEEYVKTIAFFESHGKFDMGAKIPLNFHNTEELTACMF